MAKVQVLKNKDANVILDRSIYSSASDGLQSALGLVNMAARIRCHCLMLIHKGTNGLGWNLNFMILEMFILMIRVSKITFGCPNLTIHGARIAWN